MSKWRFRKREPTNVRGMCIACGVNPQKKSARKSKKRFVGEQLYHPVCSSCRKRLQAKKVWIKY